ncbi:MAG TPA: C-terminal binding protein [Phycisphaerae bacterium]|nr:C-terminal binding protein [Phycisphaerae bacterium]
MRVMSEPVCYITDFWTGAVDVEQAALDGAARVVALGAAHESELLPRVRDAAALLVWHEIRIPAAVIDALADCKAIVRVGVGFDNVDLASARRRGIPVCNVPDYGTEDVADHALALMLALVRNLPEFASDLRAAPPRWDARHCPRTPRLRGMVFGVVGLGRIGSATALRARAFGMDVVAFDPYIPDGRDKALGVRRAETLPELLAQSHVVSLHTPLTAETRSLIDAAALAHFKRGAILLNTARGPVCDTRAVLAALESGVLGGAGLDVLPVEPPATDDPLLAAHRTPGHIAHHRCVLTPHSAFYTEEGFVEMRRKAAQEARRAIRGERLRNAVG